MARAATVSDNDHAIGDVRREATKQIVQSAGYLDGKTSRVQARIADTLLAAAKQRTGIASDTELLEYALSRVAIEDEFGSRLLALKGTVPTGIDLEF